MQLLLQGTYFNRGPVRAHEPGRNDSQFTQPINFFH